MTKSLDKRAGNLAVALLQRRWLTKNVFELELTRPPSWEFKPGQTIRFINESLERYYSLISTPQDSNLILCVYYATQGSFSPLLADADIGTNFSVTGPHGYFTYNHSERTPVFVATGTGIAPFVSMGRSGVTGFILLHEVEQTDDLYYQDLFRKIAAEYIPCISGPPTTGSLPPGAFRGSAAGFIKKNLPTASYDFYMCGKSQMIREVTLLVDEQFPGSYVFKEVYFK